VITNLAVEGEVHATAMPSIYSSREERGKKIKRIASAWRVAAGEEEKTCGKKKDL
jgi:hypothetical protein